MCVSDPVGSVLDYGSLSRPKSTNHVRAERTGRSDWSVRAVLQLRGSGGTANRRLLGLADMNSLEQAEGNKDTKQYLLLSF